MKNTHLPYLNPIPNPNTNTSNLSNPSPNAEQGAGSKIATELDIERMLIENVRRNHILQIASQGYDQLTGAGCCGERRPYKRNGVELHLPEAMFSSPTNFSTLSDAEFDLLRCRYDFEFWAARCAVIKDKRTGRDMPFLLNAPQRRVVATLEGMRPADKPIRMIMLKARQWGGSTLIQLYMAWIQTMLQRNWNSLICAHVKDTAATIRGIYSKLLENYPEECWDGDSRPEFKRFENSQNIRRIQGRGCSVTISSSESQDSIRGSDFAMAHLSEVAYWKDTTKMSPEDCVRAIYGAINSDPLTLVVLESTANGIGDFFHREWLRAVDGASDKVPVFVAWHEIDIYRKPVTDPYTLINSMTEYEWKLWNTHGLTLEMIAWFHERSRESSSLKNFLSEYPTTAEEAFRTTDSNAFDADACDRLRQQCSRPVKVGEIQGDTLTGQNALSNLHFVESPRGNLSIWADPGQGDCSGRYVVAVDIGGRSPKSDWSVIVVVDRYGGEFGNKPEVVAQWRGHCDHDHIAFTAARIARWYGNALLVFESNSLETKSLDEPYRYIMDEVADYYSNLYVRPYTDGTGYHYGFHTNRSTKSTIINHMVALIRDDRFIEHDSAAVDEMYNYRLNSAGGYEARRGCHDDRLMARAIAFYIVESLSSRNISDPSLIDYISQF